MMTKVEGAISQFSEDGNSMFHAFVEGESRVVNGQLEMLLKDGTWYPMQSKMEEIDQSYNGIKWTAFNCGRGDEPRFAGLTLSGLAMKKGKKAKKSKKGNASSGI